MRARGQAQQTESLGGMITAHDHAVGIPIRHHKTLVSGGTIIHRHQRAPRTIRLHGQQLAITARTHAEQRVHVARVDQRATCAAIHHKRFPGQRVEQLALHGAFLIEGTHRHQVIFPAHQLHGLEIGEVHVVGIGIFRVGGHEPDLLVVTTIGCHFAGQPFAVRRVQHVPHGTIDGQFHFAFLARNGLALGVEWNLERQRELILFHHDARQQPAIRGQRRGLDVAVDGP